MNPNLFAQIKLVAATSALVVAASGLGLAQQKKDAPAAPKVDAPKAERVEGVIVKAEKVARPDAKAGTKPGSALVRLSINTNAVWRDWARDQSQARDEGPAKKDAQKGANSIATKGQPADENSLVVVEVAAATKVETRFRSPTDETTRGVTSPDKVKSDESTSSAVKPGGKPVKFGADDLLPGIFVEVEFKPAGSEARNEASLLTVIRPISVINTAPAQSAPK